MLPTLFNVLNITKQVFEPESSPQSGVTILNNIVDNIKKYGQHNIVQSCFQQLVIFCPVVCGVSMRYSMLITACMKQVIVNLRFSTTELVEKLGVN